MLQGDGDTPLEDAGGFTISRRHLRLISETTLG